MKNFDSLAPQIGFVTKVDGLTCIIAAFDYMNDPTIIHNGKVIKKYNCQFVRNNKSRFY